MTSGLPDSTATDEGPVASALHAPVAACIPLKSGPHFWFAFWKGCSIAYDARMELGLDNLLLVLATAWLFGRLAVQWGYPSMLGELVGGVLLGPPVAGLLHGDAILDVLGGFGLLLMMLYMGLEVRLSELHTMSRAGLVAALGGFVLPFALGAGAAMAVGEAPVQALLVGVALGVTSLVTKSRILIDLGLLHTRLAGILLSGAVVSDVLALTAMAVVMGMANVGGAAWWGVTLTLGKLFLFLALAYLLGARAVPHLWRWLRQRGELSHFHSVSFMLICALAFARLAELAGLHAFLGTFIAGLLLRQGLRESRFVLELRGLARDISLGFLAPIFFVTLGFQLSLSALWLGAALFALLLVLAVAAKLGGVAMFYALSGRSWREGLVVGIGMNGRGAVEIVIIGIGYSTGLLGQDLFSLLVMVGLLTTAMTPLGLAWGVRWLESRGELVQINADRERYILIGAGAVARFLAHEISRYKPVCLIDLDHDKINQALEMGLEAIYGDALDPEVLRQAGVTSAQCMLAMTPNAEVNVLTMQLAGDVFFVPERFALLTQLDDGGLYRLLDELGAKPLFTQSVNIREWDEELSQQTAWPQVLRIADNPHQEFDRLLSNPQTLPLFVRRQRGIALFCTVSDLAPGDEVLVLQKGPPHRMSSTDVMV